MTDKTLVKRMEEVKKELHKRFGTEMCEELYVGCIDCDVRICIAWLNRIIGLIE